MLYPYQSGGFSQPGIEGPVYLHVGVKCTGELRPFYMAFLTKRDGRGSRRVQALDLLSGGHMLILADSARG
jgi:hypothetical protein